jgi:predicted metal-dependent hydrolase
MLRKLILALFLIVLILGVSYLKTLRGEQRERQIKKTGHTLEQNNLSLKHRVDSLEAAVQGTTAVLVDSLEQMSRMHEVEKDSLQDLVERSDSCITELQTSLEAEQRKTAKLSTRPIRQPSTTKINSHKQSEEKLAREVIDYYKQRYNDLPRDLTAYEKKVAVKEIREETTSRFSISLSKLDDLRDQFGVEY